MNDMTKKEANLPSFMQEDQNLGTENLANFIRPPRVKIVQSTSHEDFKKNFNEGTALIVPTMVPIADVEEEGSFFRFTPIFFYPEWVSMNPLYTRGTMPAVRARSLDPGSEIARKAQDPELREEEVGGLKKPIRHVENLVFIVMIHGIPEIENQPAVLTFSKAEWRAGSTLAALIKARRAPIFGCVFEGSVSKRSNADGQWYGIDCINPSSGAPLLEDEETYLAYKELHNGFKERHQRDEIKVDYDDESPSKEVDTEAAEY